MVPSALEDMKRFVPAWANCARERLGNPSVYRPPKGEPAVPEEFVIDDVRDGVIVATNNALPRASGRCD